MQVFLVNLFFGWSIIGWIIALIMAFGSDQPSGAGDITVVQTLGQVNKDGDKKDD